MPGSLSFEFSFNSAQQQPVTDELPMHILLLDNFSGHRSRTALAERNFFSVDIDNFDQVLARYAPQLDLDLSGTMIHLEFRNLEDFHPDNLFRNVPLFVSLRAQLRQDLSENLSKNLNNGLAPASPAENPFQALLGGDSKSASAQPSRFDAMIKQIVEPHLTLANPTEPAELSALQDAACSLLMRAILHHPDFKALEAAWRGVHFMLTQLELDQDLRLFLLDATKAELAQDCHFHESQLEQSASFALLAERWQHAANPVPWSLLVGAYHFDASEADVTLLAALGAIAQQVNAPWLASADSTILGCVSYAQQPEPREWIAPDAAQQARWKALCSSTQAAWLGLVMQSMLLRLPYGATTDSLESFKFEEIDALPLTEQLLWGSGALAAVTLMAQSFLDEGWDMEIGSVIEIPQLPAYTYRMHGEPILQPCAESALLERAAEAGIARGLMPLQGFRNKNAIRLLRFQSLAGSRLACRA